MSNKFKVNDPVQVPATRLGMPDAPFALMRRTIRAVKPNGRSAQVDLPSGHTSGWIGTSLLHRDIGVLVLMVGDFVTETTLLHPVQKSILQYFRLLVPDDYLWRETIRTPTELEKVWADRSALLTDLILIAHGRNDAIQFGAGTWCTVANLKPMMPSGKDIHVTSLACATGRAGFGKAMSELGWCSHFVGPDAAVHGAAATAFCTSYFALHLLSGMQEKTAFNRSYSVVPGASYFKWWAKGVREPAK